MTYQYMHELIKIVFNSKYLSFHALDLYLISYGATGHRNNDWT